MLLQHEMGVRKLKKESRKASMGGKLRLKKERVRKNRVQDHTSSTDKFNCFENKVKEGTFCWW